MSKLFPRDDLKGVAVARAGKAWKQQQAKKGKKSKEN